MIKITFLIGHPQNMDLMELRYYRSEKIAFHANGTIINTTKVGGCLQSVSDQSATSNTIHPARYLLGRVFFSAFECMVIGG